MRGRKPKEPPAWIKVGVRVDYHEIIGGPVTLANAVICSGPHRMCDHWSVWLQGMASGVDVEALTPVVTK